MADFVGRSLTVERDSGVFDPTVARALFSGFTRDLIPPDMTALSPAAGSEIARLQAIELTIEDNAKNPLVDFVWLEFADGSTDVIWDGAAFTGAYSSSSTVEDVMDGLDVAGHKYTILPLGGWVKPFTLRWRSADGDGNVST